MRAFKTRLAPHTAAAVAMTAALAVGQAHAGDLVAGRETAKKCEACHGLDGISKVPGAPNLAAQPEEYLVAQLLAFKKGERNNPTMSLIGPSLKDKEIDDLAAYYSAIQITVAKVPGQ